MAELERPLNGLRVLDLSRVLAGPFVGRMLADLGADVVKVEPPEGDVTRKWGKSIAGLSGFYTQQNVGKRDLCIDLRVAAGPVLVRRLAGVADALVENFRPGVMDQYGLGYAALSELNPRLCMLSVSRLRPDRPRGAPARVRVGRARRERPARSARPSAGGTRADRPAHVDRRFGGGAARAGRVAQRAVHARAHRARPARRHQHAREHAGDRRLRASRARRRARTRRRGRQRGLGCRSAGRSCSRGIFAGYGNGCTRRSGWPTRHRRARRSRRSPSIGTRRSRSFWRGFSDRAPLLAALTRPGSRSARSKQRRGDALAHARRARCRGAHRQPRRGVRSVIQSPYRFSGAPAGRARSRRIVASTTARVARLARHGRRRHRVALIAEGVLLAATPPA